MVTEEQLNNIEKKVLTEAYQYGLIKNKDKLGYDERCFLINLRRIIKNEFENN